MNYLLNFINSKIHFIFRPRETKKTNMKMGKVVEVKIVIDTYCHCKFFSLMEIVIKFVIIYDRDIAILREE